MWPCAAQLAHSHNMLLIATPATNLIQVMAPGSGAAAAALPPGKDRGRFGGGGRLRHPSSGDPRSRQKFVEFTRAAAAQARQVNPRIVVLAGVSTGPTGQTATAPEIAGVIRASRSYLDGYWMNVPRRASTVRGAGDSGPTSRSTSSRWSGRVRRRGHAGVHPNAS